MVKQQPKVRLGDVARAAGVSKATASKALNARTDVSSATRARVLAAVEELGYRRPVEASTYPSIALVADDLATTYTLEVVKGAADRAMVEGLALVTLYTPSSRGRVPVPFDDDWFDLVKATGYLGVIAVTSPITSHLVAKTKQIGLPFVVIDPATQVSPDMASIGATNWNGGVDATQHLLGLGHRRIAYVSGPVASVPSNERKQGFLSALQMAGIPTKGALVSGGEFSAAAGSAAARELLALPADRRPTAFFAANDVIALGIYEAVRSLGLRVPDDISVVGFDDSLMAGLVTPGLTTVRQPLSDMGSAAVRTLLDLSRGQGHHGPVRLATSLVVRASTAPPA